MFSSNNNEKRINNIIIFKGVIIGIVILLVLTTLMALFSGFLFKMSSINLNILLVIMNFLILTFVGFYVARNVEKNGWLNGGLAGLVYMVLLILIGTISIPISLISIIIMATIGLIIGSIGGILGINL